MKKQNKIEDKNSTRRESRKKRTEDEGKHNKCKWYDWSTERDFYRKVGPRNEKGERTKILERRAICGCKNAKAFRRLVMGDKVTLCHHWEEGKFVAKERETRKPEAPINDDIMTSPEEYFGPPEE